MKTYKECPPDFTIAKIESILAQNGISIRIKKSNNGYFNSCRVDIVNQRLKKIGLGTNGKGMNDNYSTASGLAELMERIQNQMIFGPNNNGSECFLEKLKKKEPDNNHNDFVDFYSVMDNSVKKMALSEIIKNNGSNGMCAGNSAKEAITQGICEIFERHVIKEIYFKQLSLPTIPIDYFKGSELYGKICGLLKQNEKLKIIIKDCSLDRGLPVIGVLIVDTEKQLYNMHLGSDCNPIVAAERCFTEMFQNTRNFYSINYDFSTIPDEVDLLKTVCFGGGNWPISIFNDKSLFTFSPNSPFYSGNIENDLEYCVNVLKRMGYNLLVRDNSFLGFPTYYVVVPEMSVLKRFQPNRDLIEISKFSRIDILSENELYELTSFLDNDYLTIKKENEIIGIKKYFPYNVNQDLENLDLNLFMALLMYRTKKYDRFIFYMDNYLKDKDKEEYVYFYAAYNFALLYRVQRQDLELVTSILQKCYGDELAKDVIDDLINPDEVFKYYKFPSYPDCSKCKLRKDCRVDEVVQICVDLRKKEIAANIDQGKLAEVFDFEI